MVSLDQIVEDAKRDFSGAADSAALEDAKARYLGKSGVLTERLKALGGMSPEERKSAGAQINQIKTQVISISLYKIVQVSLMQQILATLNSQELFLKGLQLQISQMEDYSNFNPNL